MSWHWLFFINIIPGIGITIGVLILVDFDEPNFKLLEHFDWWGLLFMAGFLGSLEYVLEEGPQYQWLQDTSVAVCAAVCLVSAIAFFWRVLTAHEPIVDIRTFGDRNFAIGCLISFCVGIGLYGLTYVYPRYLAEVRGYSALMIGETMFVSGVAMFLTAPIVGRLMTKVDMRYLIAFGLCTFALGSYQMTWITREYDFYELLVPQILRGVGMMFAMVPTNTIALGTLAPERVKNASGLFNLTRNLGGAVGLARDQPGAERAHRSAHLAAARARELGQRHRRGDAQHVHPAHAGHGRRRADGDEAIVADRPPPGGGDGLRRRLLHAGRVLCRPQPSGHAAEQAAGVGGGWRRALKRGTLTHRDCARSRGCHIANHP